MTTIDLLDLGGGRRTPLVQQSEASECGLACLEMVAGHHGLKIDLPALRRRFSLSLKGTTLKSLMEIVPEGSALQAQVYAPTRAIGFVRPGQEVRLLYDAFPYQRFGSFSGRIVGISRVVIDPRQLAAPLAVEEPVYRIDVAPDAQAVAAFGDTLPLQPGMTLSANLILERRSFLDWLLAPVRAVLRRNG